MLRSTALQEMMKRMPFRFGREGIFMDLQMVGEDRVALMGNGWMLEVAQGPGFAFEKLQSFPVRQLLEV